MRTFGVMFRGIVTARLYDRALLCQLDHDHRMSPCREYPKAYGIIHEGYNIPHPHSVYTNYTFNFITSIGTDVPSFAVSGGQGADQVIGDCTGVYLWSHI